MNARLDKATLSPDQGADVGGSQLQCMPCTPEIDNTQDVQESEPPLEPDLTQPVEPTLASDPANVTPRRARPKTAPPKMRPSLRHTVAEVKRRYRKMELLRVALVSFVFSGVRSTRKLQVGLGVLLPS